jgi:hypothetical protein
MRKIVWLLVALAFVLACSCTFFDDPFAARGFDSAVWKSYPQGGENRRFEMLNDLSSGFLRSGLSVEEIMEALGQPDFQTGLDSELSFSYVCGTPQRGFQIDPEILLLHFSEQRLVSWQHYEG